MRPQGLLVCRGLRVLPGLSNRRAVSAPLARRGSTRPMAQKKQGHQVNTPAVYSDVEPDAEAQAFQAHQSTAARLPLSEEARTLATHARFGVLSTLSAAPDTAGFPSGSAVEYILDGGGRPVFCVSSLSPHTGDLAEDGRCSLTVLAEGFKGLSDARVNLFGRVAPVPEADKSVVRELYLAKFPQSFWVDFGDFSWLRMEEVLGGRIVGGFARAGKFTGEEYLAAQADPISKFSAPIAGHMNEDHAAATAAMVKHYIGLSVEEAQILTVDRLGLNVLVSKAGQSFKARLPFPRPATDRKSVKDLIVEMTRASAAAAAAGSPTS